MNDQFKIDIILDTVDKLKANGYNEEAEELAWDAGVLFLVGLFEGD